MHHLLLCLPYMLHNDHLRRSYCLLNRFLILLIYMLNYWLIIIIFWHLALYNVNY